MLLAKVLSRVLGEGQLTIIDAAGRSHVYLAGQRVPVIGRISMDLVTIDVTDVAEAECQPGALVEVLGPHLTTDDLADHARTNAYEVMPCSIAARRRPASSPSTAAISTITAPRAWSATSSAGSR